MLGCAKKILKFLSQVVVSAAAVPALQCFLSHTFPSPFSQVKHKYICINKVYNYFSRVAAKNNVSLPTLEKAHQDRSI